MKDNLARDQHYDAFFDLLSCLRKLGLKSPYVNSHPYSESINRSVSNIEIMSSIKRLINELLEAESEEQ